MSTARPEGQPGTTRRHRRHHELTFPPGATGSCISTGRDFVAHILEGAQGAHLPLDQAAADDAALVAVELLANAADHAGGPRELDVDLTDTDLTIAVADASPFPPRPVFPHRADRIRGHGLHIVDQLSLSWGHFPTATGKTVWARLPRR
ncbi:ATP-binding protein [Streptacidiphilus monticola]|uniref:ATP-binding protein n=1 Tax=Streptacidiphilus monticola TaxID=2161674 RepID=A0ABW1G3S7_9ACTN